MAPAAPATTPKPCKTIYSQQHLEQYARSVYGRSTLSRKSLKRVLLIRTCQHGAKARLNTRRLVRRLRNRYKARKLVSNHTTGLEGWLAKVRACESGGNYSTNTGNGFYGAYQFTLSTWASVGGSGLPCHASPAEQDMRAAILYRQSGSSPWPVCG